MELKQKVQKYVSKPLARTMLILLVLVAGYTFYLNDWKTGGYYYTCENPLPYAFPPNHCIAFDDRGNEVFLLEGDTLGTKPHHLTTELTILFYSIIIIFICINHGVYLWKQS
jgi:hypothetical protein